MIAGILSICFIIAATVLELNGHPVGDQVFLSLLFGIIAVLSWP
jgi:hypothetical protein